MCCESSRPLTFARRLSRGIITCGSKSKKPGTNNSTMPRCCYRLHPPPWPRWGTLTSACCWAQADHYRKLFVALHTAIARREAICLTACLIEWMDRSEAARNRAYVNPMITRTAAIQAPCHVPRIVPGMPHSSSCGRPGSPGRRPWSWCPRRMPFQAGDSSGMMNAPSCNRSWDDPIPLA